MKRILALDGGGIRGVFTLEILLKIEELLREHYRQQDPEKAKTFVLRDHFDFLAGTSTGAIIATCLCWGMSVERVMDLYMDYGPKMFQPVPWYRPITRYLIARLNAKPLTEQLQRLFPKEGGEDPTLGCSRLTDGEKKNLLMVVVHNLTTGSAWPLTNNPLAKYANRSRPDCNLNIPLWKLVRASTAAPTYFPPEEVKLGDEIRTFVDGGITPYNNPALIAAMTAILPGYRVNWTPGPENIRVVSVGTIQFSSEVRVKNQKLWVGYYASQIPEALLQAMSWQQDYLCRFLGDCIFAETTGSVLDSEVGDLLAGNVESAPPRGRSWFSYVRYNRTYRKDDLEKILREHPLLAKMDAVEAIPSLRRVGREYADEHVKLNHLI
jgi:patatin-like phospholipase/acyl hydrolase